jgi:hypothetical protein
MHPLLTGHIRCSPSWKLGVQDYLLSKPVWKQQYNKEYGTNHSEYKPAIICNRRQRHYSDRNICEMIILNKIRYNPATSTFFQ